MITVVLSMPVSQGAHGDLTEEFDSYLAKGLSPANRATPNFRMRPFGFASKGIRDLRVFDWLDQTLAARAW